MERIGLTGVVASRSFQNILSVLYEDGLSRFVEDCCERIIEGGFIEDLINVDIALYQDLFDCIFI